MQGGHSKPLAFGSGAIVGLLGGLIGLGGAEFRRSLNSSDYESYRNHRT
jgi:hypothetical protein